jgi:hypothetical protein
MTEKYVYRDGSRYTVPAEVVGAELERIRSDGELTASAVVEAAKPKGSPLHPLIEHSNKKAADAYRLIQARRLIRSVEIIRDDGERAPMFVHVPKITNTDEGSYETPEYIVQRPDMFALALAEAVRRVGAAEDAVRELQRAAAASDDQDRLARVAIAAKAVQTASDAIRALH